MLINLFEDQTIFARASQPLGYMLDRDCVVVDDLKEYEEISSDDPYVKQHIEGVRNSLKHSDRYYIPVLGDRVDSHSEVEKLGVCAYQKVYTVIVSMEDSLSYILHRLSGASTANIRSIPNYINISRGILNMNYEAMKTMNFDVLFECDPLLGKYLNELYFMKTEEGRSQTDSFTERFVTEVLGTLKNILQYVVFSYHFSFKTGEMILRSKSLSSFVFTSKEKREDVLELVQEGFETHTLQVRSFKRKEYSKYLDLVYAI